jgi:hypothetical protein
MFFSLCEHKQECSLGRDPTDDLRGFMVGAATELDVAKQSHFIREISARPWFKGSAGHVFEEFVHVRLLASSSFPCGLAFPSLSFLHARMSFRYPV